MYDGVDVPSTPWPDDFQRGRHVEGVHLQPVDFTA